MHEVQRKEWWSTMKQSWRKVLSEYFAARNRRLEIHFGTVIQHLESMDTQAGCAVQQYYWSSDFGDENKEVCKQVLSN